jgi:N-acetylglucosaminyldiphosphoundecaprenol N-acetyl-beta-D-mannosaminyltransferase
MPEHEGSASKLPDAGPAARILETPVSTVTQEGLLDAITHAVDARRSTVFVGLYAALFRTLRHSEVYRDLVARSVTYPDGSGVVRELRKRAVPDAERLATTDVIHPLARLAEQHRWRIGLYGAAPGVAERAAAALRTTAPQLDIVGVWDGYSGGPSTAELADARLDVVLVALGAERQERWAFEVGVAAGVPAVVTCGGLFDFLAGDRRRAPTWMQRSGLEWVFRTLLEPRRLFARYLLGNSFFLLRARAERVRQQRGST